MQSQIYKTLTYEVNDKGVAVITIDVKDRPVNVLTLDFYDDLHRVIGYFAQDENARAALIQSGKDTFFAGGDLKRLVNMYAMNRTPEVAYEQSRFFTTALRKFELCGKPMVVAINGSAMGGGLELALACNYRVVVDETKVFMGLPEVTLGLLPGGGGTQRMSRMLGVEKAAELILSGKTFSPEEALELGVVDAIVSRDELFSTAEKLLLGCEDSTRAWDRRGYALPGGSGLGSPKLNGIFQKLSCDVGAKYFHNYPAPIAALRCLFKGSSCSSIDKGLEVESREFSGLTGLVQTRNIIRTKFLNKGSLDRQVNRPLGVDKSQVSRLALADSQKSDLPPGFEKSLVKAAIDLVPVERGEAEIVLLPGLNSVEELKNIAQGIPEATIAICNAAALNAVVASEELEELAGRIVGVNISVTAEGGVIEIGVLENDISSDASIARCFDLAKQLRMTPIRQLFREEWLSNACLQAFQKAADQMTDEGVSASLIVNGARFASYGRLPDVQDSVDGENLDVEVVKQRFLSSQSLVAANYIEHGLITAVEADVLSLLACGYPSWTGGVVSYIDMLGVKEFVQQCDTLGDQFLVSEWLRDGNEELFYPKFLD